MSTTIRFRDHEEFHRAALHMAVAGGLTGLAAHVAGLLAPGFGGLAGPWALAALAGATAYGAADPEKRMRVMDLALVAVVAVAVGLALTLGGTTGRGAIAGSAVFAVGLGGLFARGSKRFVPTLVTGAAVALLSRYVLIRLVEAGDAAALPPWVTVAIAGVAFSFVAVFGLLPRHVDIGENRVEDAWASCRGILTGEVRDLADRGMGVWKKVEGSLDDDSSVRTIMEDSVIRLFDVGRRWAMVDGEARTPADELAMRMQQITEKMERTSDDVAKNQYRQAHEALAEQLRYLKDISTARERVLARMHHYLAAMERLRLAVINSRSADASRIAVDVQPILDDLTDLGKEIDLASEAMGEVDRDSTVARAQA